MSAEMNGPFYDIKRYLHRLHKEVTSLFDYPTGTDYVRLREDSQGRLIGWEIDREKFIFKYQEDYLKITERAEVKNVSNCFYLRRFSYHFQPAEGNDLLQFRIDLDSISLHGNPDEKFGRKQHLCYPED